MLINLQIILINKRPKCVILRSLTLILRLQIVNLLLIRQISKNVKYN